jgi:6-pyruvoyltetrahydropterin/6-carboxytetrahydropterin synthase
MMTIWAETTVSAAHRFGGYDLHGHTYHVRVSIRETPGHFVNAEGFLTELQEIRKGVDHRCLNDILPIPTMEELARWFAREVGRFHDVAEVAITRAEGLGCRLAIPAATAALPRRLEETVGA